MSPTPTPAARSAASAAIDKAAAGSLIWHFAGAVLDERTMELRVEELLADPAV
ncbi:hypothetical protein [Hydrocarboniphaga sp.]|uniref:hypothetical protein n=1 Tax=Hydrocarboniphaga sp. TaxID=2033016 RepID=UPI00260B9CE7|nr:hypothetical protein [Hydrocarboniphaga sp.]